MPSCRVGVQLLQPGASDCNLHYPSINPLVFAFAVQGNCPICHGSLLYYGEKGLGVEVTRFVDESMQVCAEA